MQLLQRRDLAALCLTCQHLNSLVTPLLYRSILVKLQQIPHGGCNDGNEVPQYTSSALRNAREDRLELVQEIIFDFSAVQQCVGHTSYYGARQEAILSDHLRNFLSRVEVSRLRSLRYLQLW